VDFREIVLVSTDGTVKPIYTRQPSVSVTTTSSSGMSSLSAQVIHWGSPRPEGAPLYYHGDHLGSARLLSGYSGYPIATYTYGPYGEEFNPQTTVNHYKFTGKERDGESGLDNFGARYHGSNLGRFTSPDPKTPHLKHLLNPQKWNKYAYTINNPLRYIDPDGLEEIDVQLRAFIPQRNVGPYRGDSRGFTTLQNVTSRTSITIRVETDPSRRANPLLNNPKGIAGQTENIVTGSKATQTNGLPGAQVSRDANGNVVINVKQDAANPLAPGAPGIRSDLNITITPNASSITTSGTVSGSPAFELNVGGEGGTNLNIPLQNAPSGTAGFVGGLAQDNPILNFTPLPPPPPPPCRDGSQSGCSE
jgi:RHS repeat-associated protein